MAKNLDFRYICAMSVFDVPMTAASVADLADAGLTLAEIADAAGVDAATVRRELGPARSVELAIYDQAIGGTTWRETMTADGPARLMADRRPDVAAGKAYLAVHDPERWGQEAGAGAQVVINVIGALPASHPRRIAQEARIAIESTATDVTPREPPGASTAGGPGV